MEEQIINQLLSSLGNSLAIQDLDLIRANLGKILDNYDIEPKKHLPEVVNVIPDVYKSFMVSKRIEGMSVNSLKIYDSILSNFFKEMLKPIQAITSNDIRLYLYDKSNNKNISMRYVNFIRTVLSSFFVWCYKEKYVDKNPLENIAPIKYTKKIVEPLTEKQIELCRIAYKDMSLRDQLVFEFLYSTGCRASEVCNLNKDSINFENKSIVVLGKGNKYRTVYMSERTAIMLLDYFNWRKENGRDNNWVFVSNRAPYNNITVHTLENIIKKIGDKAGIKIHPHMLRHTMATIALNRGMPIEEVQILLGHSSTDTTMIYSKVNISNIQYHYSKYIS